MRAPEKVSTRADQPNMGLAYEAIHTDIITDKYLLCLCELGYFCPLLQIIDENSELDTYSYSG